MPQGEPADFPAIPPNLCYGFHKIGGHGDALQGPPPLGFVFLLPITGFVLFEKFFKFVFQKGPTAAPISFQHFSVLQSLRAECRQHLAPYESAKQACFLFGAARPKPPHTFCSDRKYAKNCSREGGFRFPPSLKKPIPLKRPRRGPRPPLLDSPPERKMKLQAPVVPHLHFARWSGSGKKRTTCPPCTKPAARWLCAGILR